MDRDEFEGHSLWGAVNDLRDMLVRADQAASQDQWPLLDRLRFDQLQYVIRGMRARQPPPKAAAAATATLDRLHRIVAAAAGELGAFLSDRSSPRLVAAVDLVDQALDSVGVRLPSASRPATSRTPASSRHPASTTAVATGAAAAPGLTAAAATHRPPPRARARHAKRTSGAALFFAAVLLIVLTALGSVIAIAAGSDSDPDSSAGGCTELRIVATASYRPALDAVRASLARQPECVRLDVTVADGRPAEPVVDRERAHVWITDDAAWLARYEAEEVAAGDAEAESEYSTLATSPVLFAAGSAVSPRLQQAGGGWTDLAAMVAGDRPVRIVTKDPASSGDGLVALGGLGDAVWDAQGMDASALLLDEARRDHRTESLLGAPKLGPHEVALVPEHLLGGQRGEDAVVMMPTDRTAMMRYSWYPTDVDGDDPAIESARAALLALLTKGPSADAAREAAHLRDVRGEPPTMLYAEETWVGRQLPPANPVLDAHKVEHVFATWYAADRVADVLVVVDVSGSMAASAPGSDRSMISLVRQNVKQLARRLPANARLGVWGFGSRLDGRRDYVVVDPLRPLTPDHRERLAARLNRLTPQDTGTGLFDTVLAAYRSARAAARPDVDFQVMVFTDGLNQDDPRAISAGDLRQTLAQSADPQTPVGLTVVEVGRRPTARLENALEPIGGEVATIVHADDIVASFIHLAAGGLHD